MSCDIHMFTEQKIGDHWETADFFHYELKEIEPISTPHGIPKDLSEFVKVWYEIEKNWTFCHSYLTLRDILEFKPEKYYYEDENEENETFNWLIEKLKERVKEIWWRFDCHPEEYLDNFRLVFWFDNLGE